MTVDKNEIIQQHLANHKECLSEILQEKYYNIIINISEAIVSAMKTGKKLITFGNGGSAADAQHIVAEFTGRYKLEREPLPAIALTTNTSALTAIANDYDFNNIFIRQLSALGQKGDVVIGFSTSGTSQNVLEAFEYAKKAGIEIIAFVGEKKEHLEKYTDYIISVPSSHTPIIQEMHIMIGHIICDIVECEIYGR